MKSWIFWICWGLDALVLATVLVFFVIGMADGSISSFNIVIWFFMLAVPAVILGGGLVLKKLGHPIIGIILLLLLAVPGLLAVLFQLLVLLSDGPWI